MRSARAFIPAAILLVGCAFNLKARRQERIPLPAPLATLLPPLTPQLSRPGDHLTDSSVVIDADQRRVAAMDDYVLRSYQRDTAVAFTTFVSYYEHQSQGRTIHSPKNCLPGAGWEVLNDSIAKLMVDGVGRPANRYVLKNGPQTAIVYYWYQGRGRVAANEYTVKWNLLRDAALLGHTEESLVRVYVPVAMPTERTDSAVAAAYTYADSVGQDVSIRLMKQVAGVLPGGLQGTARGAAVSRPRTATSPSL